MNMGSTFRFVAAPAETHPVLQWFRALPTPPHEMPTERGLVLYFRDYGQLAYAIDGSILTEDSPVATLFLPRVECGVLWTVGELHFLPKRMPERFPELAKLVSAFSRWLRRLPCVYTNKLADNRFDYFFEGSVMNYDTPVYAFECGLDALHSGQYFVDDGDNRTVLDNICRKLRLRGINCVCS
jgi:hypothetical protein